MRLNRGTATVTGVGGSCLKRRKASLCTVVGEPAAILIEDAGDAMDTTDRIYRDLQRHLDRQAVGFPATKSGAEIRILKRLFSPEEARLALHLTYKPAPLDRICELAEGAGYLATASRACSTSMVRNGAIEHTEKDGTRHFWTMPFVVGMFEYQLKRLTPEFLERRPGST